MRNHQKITQLGSTSSRLGSTILHFMTPVDLVISAKQGMDALGSVRSLACFLDASASGASGAP
jgi:hypothetical protein